MSVSGFRSLMLILAVATAIMAAGCAAPPLDPPPIPTVPPEAADEPRDPAPSMSVPEAAPAGEMPAAGAQPAQPVSTAAPLTPAALTQAQIEELVLADLSAARGLAPSEAHIVASDLRNWEDTSLDCNARRGVLQRQPTPGYLIQIDVNGKVYEYHTDLFGNFVLCPTPSKPLDPIR